jgi:hypothetical protein
MPYSLTLLLLLLLPSLHPHCCQVELLWRVMVVPGWHQQLRRSLVWHLLPAGGQL